MCSTGSSSGPSPVRKSVSYADTAMDMSSDNSLSASMHAPHANNNSTRSPPQKPKLSPEIYNKLLADFQLVSAELKSLQNDYNGLLSRVNSHEDRIGALEAHMVTEPVVQTPLVPHQPSFHQVSTPQPSIVNRQVSTPPNNRNISFSPYQPIIASRPAPTSFPLSAPSFPTASPLPAASRPLSPLQLEVSTMGKRFDTLNSTMDTITATLSTLVSGDQSAGQQ